MLPDWKILSATLANPDALPAALKQAGPCPLVYPVFMTDGWFTQAALPKRLNGSRADVLPPLGVDPVLVPLAAHRLKAELEASGWSAEESCLVVAAHGSGRSRNPARETRDFANALQALTGFGTVRTGFIEEQPSLAEALANSGSKAICLPFFASRRDHVLDDLPAAVKDAGFRGKVLEPVGLFPSVPSMIALALVAAVTKEKAA